MFMFITSRPYLWRKIRFGAFSLSFRPSSHQTKVGACFHPYIMENSFSIKALLENDKDTKLSLTSKSNLTIAVEGNIGSGKSTLLKHFELNDSFEVITEPIEKWTNVKGHNALSLLYADPMRWSFSFNMYAMLTRVNMHLKASDKPVKLLERSLHSTKTCFIENSFQTEMINRYEYSILNQWFNHLTTDPKTNLDLIIYLRVDPDVCYERLKERSRKEEADVPQEFLESLHTLHDDWLLHKKYSPSVPVLVLDANSDLSTMKEVYSQTQQDILCNYC